MASTLRGSSAPIARGILASHGTSTNSTGLHRLRMDYVSQWLTHSNSNDVAGASNAQQQQLRMRETELLILSS